MRTSKKLAENAMQSKEYKLMAGETVEAKDSTLIQLYVQNLTTYQEIEGVHIKRTPKPVEREHTDATVKKMVIMSNLINEEFHMFKQLIILN